MKHRRCDTDLEAGFARRERAHTIGQEVSIISQVAHIVENIESMLELQCANINQLLRI